MTTKEKILVKSLELFNEKGVETVTTRQIALALGMSQGNLCYHFPKKEAIITALYEQLVERFNTMYLQLNINELSISLFFELTTITNQYFIDYKFLMLNFVQIMRWHPSIKSHYQALTLQRNEQMIGLFQTLEQANLLKSEAYEGQFKQVIEQIMILNNFWLSHAEILYQGNQAEKIKHFNKLVGAFIFPYLTEKGQSEYKQLIIP